MSSAPWPDGPRFVVSEVRGWPIHGTGSFTSGSGSLEASSFTVHDRGYNYRDVVTFREGHGVSHATARARAEARAAALNG